MSKLDSIGDDKFIFGSLFGLANKLQVLLDKELSVHDITAKQWFLSIVIANLFDEPPTINEVARAIETSHQNVKQVALKLQEKGFLDIKGDERDGRALRLSLTQKSDDFWNSTQKQSSELIDSVFKGLDEEQMAMLRSSLNQISINIDMLNQKFK